MSGRRPTRRAPWEARVAAGAGSKEAAEALEEREAGDEGEGEEEKE